MSKKRTTRKLSGAARPAKSVQTPVPKLDPMADLVALIDQAIVRLGVRGLSRLTAIPPTTISLKRKHPERWEIRQLRRILEATAEAHRITIEPATTKAASARESRQTKIAA